MLLHFRAAAARRRQEHNGRAWLAWTVAALPKTKRFPKLHALMMREPLRRQAPQVQFALLKTMMAVLGAVNDRKR